MFNSQKKLLVMFTLCLSIYLGACVVAGIKNYRDGVYSGGGNKGDDIPNFPSSGDYGGV